MTMIKYYLKNTSPSADGDSVIFEIYSFETEELIKKRILYGIIVDSELKNNKDCELNKKEFDMICILDEYSSAIIKGKSLLMYSQSTKKGLVLKLYRYGFSKEACEYASKYLSKKGYINEKLQGELLLDNLANKKLYGPKRISKDLYSKGFPLNLIKEILSETEIDFGNICAKRISKTCDILELENIDDRNKVFSKLLSYGFSMENIKRALEILNEET